MPLLQTTTDRPTDRVCCALRIPPSRASLRKTLHLYLRNRDRSKHPPGPAAAHEAVEAAEVRLRQPEKNTTQTVQIHGYSRAAPISDPARLDEEQIRPPGECMKRDCTATCGCRGERTLDCRRPKALEYPFEVRSMSTASSEHMDPERTGMCCDQACRSKRTRPVDQHTGNLFDVLCRSYTYQRPWTLTRESRGALKIPLETLNVGI